MTINDIVDKFNTTPFLFIGSGMTRRYLNLPDWKGLLEHFANEVEVDPFKYSFYVNLAQSLSFQTGLEPKVAELIQHDYDRKWFAHECSRTNDADLLEQIKQEGLSPFKAEVAAYIKNCSVINSAYQEEIDKLTEISAKSIAGVITTNYDSFLEDHFLGYKKYVGQTELIFSPLQGIAEIYKIHGSIEKPATIVINEADYMEFKEKSCYLAAKLMTIFMEYPIIFMGYSIRDDNIQSIINSIVQCLNEDQIRTLEDRFVFVEYKKNTKKVEVSPYTYMIGGKPLIMRKVVLEDYLPLYQAIGKKRATIPVRILRQLKEEFYGYVITNTPTTRIQVAPLNDSRIKDDQLVLSIGKSLNGLIGVDGNSLYQDIILNDLGYSADELLEGTFLKLYKQNSHKLPIHKYISMATKDFPECLEIAKEQDFEHIISRSLKKARENTVNTYHSIVQVWEQKKTSLTLDKATRLIACFPEEAFNVMELERILCELFHNDTNILKNVSDSEKTNIRRLILIYDYLKWGKK